MTQKTRLIVALGVMSALSALFSVPAYPASVVTYDLSKYPAGDTTAAATIDTSAIFVTFSARRVTLMFRDSIATAGATLGCYNDSLSNAVVQWSTDGTNWASDATNDSLKNAYTYAGAGVDQSGKFSTWGSVQRLPSGLSTAVSGWRIVYILPYFENALSGVIRDESIGARYMRVITVTQSALRPTSTTEKKAMKGLRLRAVVEFQGNEPTMGRIKAGTGN